LASNWPPVKNAAFTLYFFVHKSDGTIIANPTLASSAVHVDGSATEITDCTLAVVDSTTGLCSIALTAAAMNGDQIDVKVVASDTGAVPYTAKILTSAQTIDTVAAQISSIGSGTGAAMNFEIVADNKTTPLNGITVKGTSANTFANTLANDTTYHILVAQNDAGTYNIDWVYKFSCGAGRNATKVVFRAAMAASGDTVSIQAYNFFTTSWDARTNFTGTTMQLVDVPLLAGHTGIGADSGVVYLRLIFSEGDTGTINVNEVYCQAQNLGQTIGYQDGAVWVDTNAAANTNTTPFVDGTADNPVTTMAAAYTIAAAVGINSYRFASGSVIQLTQTAAHSRFQGSATIDLNGQDITEALFRDAYSITDDDATPTGEDARFIDCGIANLIIKHAYFEHCLMKGTITLADNFDYSFTDCSDYVSGGGTLTLIFGANSNVYMRNYRGGVELQGLASTSECIIDGSGRILIHSDCTTGTLTIRGHFTVTDEVVGGFEATGGGHINDSARWAEDQTVAWNASWDAEVQSECADALTAYDPPTATEMTTAFTEIKGATWAGTDTLEAIHDDLVTAQGNITSILEDTGTTLDTLVKDIPTNAELATALGTADDAVLAAVAATDAKVDTVSTAVVTTIPGTITTLQGNVTDILEDTGTTLDTLVKDLPTNAELATALAGADDATLAAVAAVKGDTAAILLDTGTDGVVVNAAGFATDVSTELISNLLATDYTTATTTNTFGRWLNAVRELMGHKSVENAGSTSVSYKAADDTVEKGTISWDEANKTRGKYTGW
jgi:hypothetical protein